MPLFPDSPIESEWVALITLYPEQAESIKRSLLKKTDNTNLTNSMSNTSVADILSLQAYDTARHILEQDDDQNTQSKRELLIRIGSFTFNGYPTSQVWHQLIQEDQSFAKHLYYDLYKRKVSLGMSVPKALVESIRAYEDILGVPPLLP